MKGILKNILLNAFALFITSLIFEGLVLQSGLTTLLMGGLLLSIGFKILKPILSLITLPFNMLTLGLFSTCIIAFIMFLITLIYPQISVQSFFFQGVKFGGIEIHAFEVSLLLSYFVISVTIYLIASLINWLFS